MGTEAGNTVERIIQLHNEILELWDADAKKRNQQNLPCEGHQIEL